MRQLVVIDDGLIFTMLNDNAFASTIPCFFNKREIFNQPLSSCGSCAQKTQDRRRKEMATIKMCLAALSPEKKQELRTLLDAEQVRVVYVNNAGQVVQLTF